MSPSTGAPTRPRPATGTRPGARPGWRTPAALLALCAIPIIAGSLRLLEVAGGPQLLPANPRVDAAPVPVVIHVVAATCYAVAGAFQFSTAFRRRRPRWHRIAGRFLAVAGLTVAGSALWMTLFSVGAPGGDLLWAVRLLAGSAMATAIVLGITAVRRHDLAAHRAWMIRAYALAVAAGTQTITQGVGEAAFGVNDLTIALSLTCGWVVNAIVAEWIIRRRPRGRSTAAAGGPR